MKRFILAFLLCLFISVSASAGMIVQTVASGGAQEGSFHIEFDSDTDWTDPAATYTMGGNDYSDGDTTGTITGNVTRNVADYISSGQSLQIDTAADSYIEFAASDLITLTKGEVHIDIHAKASTGYTYIFEAYYDANNFIAIAHRDASDVRATHMGNGVRVDKSSGSCVDHDWCAIEVRWDVAAGTGDGLQIRVCGDGACNGESWVTETDPQDVTAYSTDVDKMYLGGDTTITDEIEIDNVTVYYNEWN